MIISDKKYESIMKLARKRFGVCIHCSRPGAVYWGSLDHPERRCTHCRGLLSSEEQIQTMVMNGTLVILADSGLMLAWSRFR